MNPWKPNTSPGYRLGLGILLCIAVLVVSTGTAYARYRTEREAEIMFAVREEEPIYLGRMRTITKEEATETLKEGDEVFTTERTLRWEEVNGEYRLNLTIANGLSDTKFSRQDRKVTLRVLATLGAWTGTETAEVYLEQKLQTDPETTQTLQAKVESIAEDSVLDRVHGSGWIYSFWNEEEELSWVLPGGKFSCVHLTITVKGAVLQESAAFRPQVTAEIIDP